MFYSTVITVLFAYGFYGVQAIDSNFVLANAERYVKLSGAAYCTDPKLRKNSIDNWSCKVCENFPNMTAHSFKSAKNDANGFVGYDGDANEIIVSFSGTNPLSIRNWIDDLNFLKTNYPYCDGCEVHQGFYNAYLSVQDSVKSYVSSFQAQHPSASLAVTGHSLGAAMAAHAVAEFTHMGQVVSSSYTYGMPRVGEESFETWYTSVVPGTFRVVHRQDPVPKLAPQSFDFHHMPYEVCSLLLYVVFYSVHALLNNDIYLFPTAATLFSPLLLHTPFSCIRCSMWMTTRSGSCATWRVRTPPAATSTATRPTSVSN
jgi:hypothetical protein